MTLNNDDLKDQIPYYLTQEAKLGLIKALSGFPENINYFTSLYPSELLQGDGVDGLQVINFDDGTRKSVKGILLSNSCDMDCANQRELPIKITFAPLINLDKYIGVLSGSGLDPDKIQNKISSIKEQKVTNIFFLPKNNSLNADHIALLSDLYTIPLSSLNKGVKLFTLSQVGFYLFLFKLSVHFCRFHENINR